MTNVVPRGTMVVVPFEPNPNGQTRIRMPIELHEDLIAEAERQNASLNTFMVSVLAGAVGFKLDKTAHNPHTSQKDPAK